MQLNFCVFCRKKKAAFLLPNVETCAILYQVTTCRCSSMAECQLPKLNTGVRFPSPAPQEKDTVSAVSFSCGLRHIRGRRSEASFLRPAFFVNRKDIHKDVLSLAEISGIEPLLFVCLKASLHPDKEEPEILRFRVLGGDKRDRTADLLNAIQALSQLSYTPI